MNDQTAPAATGAEAPLDRLIGPVRPVLHLASGLAGAGQALTLAPLAGIGWLAGDIPATAAGHVLLVCLLGLGLGLALITLAEVIAHLADNRLTEDLRLRLAAHLARLPLDWFSRHGSGQVKQLLQDDIAALHGLVGHYYTTRARCIGAIAASALWLLWSDWRLAILCLIPVPLFHLIFGLTRRAISAERMQDFITHSGRINAAVIEFVQAAPVFRTFGMPGRAPDGYRGAVEGFTASFLRFTRPLVAPMANANAIIAPVTLLALALGAGTVFVWLGWSSPAGVLPFVLIVPGISAPLMLHGYLGHAIPGATAAAARIIALLDTPPLAEATAATAQHPADDTIRIEALSHAFDGGAEVLSEIDLTLKPGTVTALVGPSGAGKTTLARLILRFDDPTRGRITLGGADLRLIPAAELRRRIGFVLQEAQLIHATLRDNIALGRPDATPDRIEAAARSAQIHDRILALPRGYDSVVGEDARLSGGEAQRIGIARALLLDAPVLVLDEATAAIDAETEAAVQSALAGFAKGRSLLVIAHRLETVQHADRILVLDAGRITEDGRHADLLAKGGTYARLWQISEGLLP